MYISDRLDTLLKVIDGKLEKDMKPCTIHIPSNGEPYMDIIVTHDDTNHALLKVVSEGTVFTRRVTLKGLFKGEKFNDSSRWRGLVTYAYATIDGFFRGIFRDMDAVLEGFEG